MPLTKKFVQKIYIMYKKITQNTKFVCILYTKIVQIKTLYDNECTKKLHHISTTKNVQNVQNLYKVQTKNGLKLEMYVFCTYKHRTNYTKPIQLAN